MHSSIGSYASDNNWFNTPDRIWLGTPDANTGEDGVVKVEGNTVYYEDYYEVYDVENDIIREITVFSDGQPGNHFKMNEFGQLMKMELCDSNGVYYELEYTYQEIPVES